VRLHDSYGLVSSQRWPDAWNSEQPAVMANQVQVGSSDPVRYGAVMADGRPEALVPIWCTNGGGTADGQLGQGLVVYHESRDGPAVTGIITTGQSNDHTMAYFGDAATRIERGRIRVKPPRTRTVVAAQTDGRERACGWGSATRVARRRYSEGCLREVSRDPVEAIPEARRRWLEDLFRRAGPMSAPEVEERERQAGPERRAVPRAAERP